MLSLTVGAAVQSGTERAAQAVALPSRVARPSAADISVGQANLSQPARLKPRAPELGLR